MFSRTCNPICNRKRVLGEFEIKSPSLNGSCAPGKSETEYQECSIMSTCPTEESSTVDMNNMDTAELKRKTSPPSWTYITDGLCDIDYVRSSFVHKKINKFRVHNDY